ncbi:hypothetical protein LR48_Vigan630s001500 [Vigna angularis]|uniref:Uncharacterized protein n=1 Tax=Phaseolus angularis TaxID=3914 RepID=A0A0L9TF69_PHAAN|nr:hypothetical protein LR48_Vigan630s001500 [Vigna angularis]
MCSRRNSGEADSSTDWSERNDRAQGEKAQRQKMPQRPHLCGKKTHSRSGRVFPFEATREGRCSLGANNVAVTSKGSDDALQGVPATTVEGIVVPIL